jgi:hypothetical protein
LPQQVLDGVVSDSFIRNWLDLLSFLLSGLPANGTIAAEVAFMVSGQGGHTAVVLLLQMVCHCCCRGCQQTVPLLQRWPAW